MAVVFDRPQSLVDVPTHFCPGCGHGIVHRLVCEVLDEMNLTGDAIGVAPVGCSVMSYNYFGCDMIQAPHGRAPAVATGAKRVNPDKIVFTYQGDGDLAAIGTAETVHVGTRGENIVIIFINNTTYGMTGGQMAPTTLMGMKTSTCPYGRQADLHGFPLHITDIAATLEGTCYVTRQAVNNVANIARTKRAIRQAFQNSIDRRGASMVEVVSTCAAGWKKSPLEANKWMEDNMFPYYPLGDIKNTINETK